MSNSQMWATQMDAAIMIAMASIFFCGAIVLVAWRVALSVDDERPLSASRQRPFVGSSRSSTLRPGGGNSASWLHPDYSCGSLFTVQPLEYPANNVLFVGWQHLGDGGAGDCAHHRATGPAYSHPRGRRPRTARLRPAQLAGAVLLGVAATLVFHAIALTPPPSERLDLRRDHVHTALLHAPRRRRRRLAEAHCAQAQRSHPRSHDGSGGRRISWRWWRRCMRPLPAPSKAWAPTGAADTTWLSSCSSRVRRIGVAGVHKPPPEHALREAPVSTRQITISLVYAFLLPVLGLQEKSGCLMFSQLRLHGGSNHLVLPTSLLQRVFIDARADHAFAGGVVRVEETNLEWVGNTFAEHMGERTQRLVREVAKVPAQYVWAAKATSQPRSVPPPRFMRHTLSNLGLRQLLQTASNQRDDFWLRFTRLEGAEGDEAWRTSSGGVEYVVHGKDGEIRCARRGAFATQQPCDEREARLLAKPDRLTSALAYFLIPQPNPIVPGYTEEMHCVTWG